MCPSISAISDRSFRGSVNYCMPMVLNIKEHEQFFKKCVQKMLTTADGDAYSTGTFYKAFVVVNGELYKITVNGGDDPLSSGQLIVSTLAVDESLDEEITDKL